VIRREASKRCVWSEAVGECWAPRVGRRRVCQRAEITNRGRSKARTRSSSGEPRHALERGGRNAERCRQGRREPDKATHDCRQAGRRTPARRPRPKRHGCLLPLPTSRCLGPRGPRNGGRRAGVQHGPLRRNRQGACAARRGGVEPARVRRGAPGKSATEARHEAVQRLRLAVGSAPVTGWSGKIRARGAQARGRDPLCQHLCTLHTVEYVNAAAASDETRGPPSSPRTERGIGGVASDETATLEVARARPRGGARRSRSRGADAAQTPRYNARCAMLEEGRARLNGVVVGRDHGLEIRSRVGVATAVKSDLARSLGSVGAGGEWSWPSTSSTRPWAREPTGVA